jgi:crotonobetainyl-CoA:carnitine CoA-transferase CaiB-like acyl-CoA transferase
MDLRPKPADGVPTGGLGTAARPGSLTGIRVIEMADEQAEYCGLTLAGLGADVLKIEPPGGNPTRHIGPFYQDKPDPEGSLFFWQYNRGKRSVVLDLDGEVDREKLRSLLAETDVLLESTPKGRLEAIDLGKDALTNQYPTLIHARITPFATMGLGAITRAATSFIWRSAA